VIVVVLSGLAEFAGALGPSVGAARRYEGPAGKSDPALAFGALGLWLGLAGPRPDWAAWAPRKAKDASLCTPVAA
jgi:CDP-diacylglycerol--glycerol-3-phosphate 3-phosphatidyltransferase